MGTPSADLANTQDVFGVPNVSPDGATAPTMTRTTSTVANRRGTAITAGARTARASITAGALSAPTAPCGIRNLTCSASVRAEAVNAQEADGPFGTKLLMSCLYLVPAIRKK